MLSSLNKNDLEKMLRYGRTKDMLQLQEFFPEFCPFEELVVFENFDDIEKRGKEFDDASHRVDTPIGDKVINRKWKNECDGGKSHLESVKSENPDGVVLAFRQNPPMSTRYGVGGGISIAVHLGHSIHIEMVGKGFDGHKLTKGNVRHEIFYVPWGEIGNLNLRALDEHRTFEISPEEYHQDVKHYEEELVEKYDYPPHEVENKIPREYTGSSRALLDAIKIIKKLPDLESDLKRRGLDSFIIQGNIEQDRFTPWQVSGTERFLAAAPPKLKALIDLPKYSKIAMFKRAQLNSTKTL